MRMVFRVGDGWLQAVAAEAGLDAQRPVGAEDTARLTAWATSYRALLGRHGGEARLLALGRQLYAWLDGGERWLERLLDAAEPPMVVEFQAPARPDELARAFLQAPWELLAESHGYLAGDALLRYCPVRRLGQASEQAAVSEHCLGLMFMAAAPRGVDVLDFEAEENAILDATGGLHLDLVVEESGNPARLAERLTAVGPMQVVHLSCHGRSQPEPVLLLEDDEGAPLQTDASALFRALQFHLPHLLFVSACESAAPGDLAAPLAMTLVRAGVAAVLGWDGTVYDHEARDFARELYASLSRQGSLEEAVGAARQALLHSTGAQPSRDWHLARLWLGRRGGGVLVGGSRRRLQLSKDHGHKEFLDARRQQSPVASREAFVGRRRQLQTSLQVLRQGQHAGLLIHGMGRLGKSSLAARIAHRRPDLRPAVVFGHYDALSVVAAIRDACPAAGPIIDAARNDLRNAPGMLEDLLRRVLEGPCAQASTGMPILLVIDDLEQIMDEPVDGSGLWRMQATYQPVVRAVLRAFALAHTDSRLLLTSRYRFTLPDSHGDLAERLYALPLPPMDAAGARKQALRLQASQPLTAASRAEQQQALLTRCLELAQGNPGLQDLLTGLVLAAPDTATVALDEMAAYLARGDLPAQPQVHAFLENLTLDHLLILSQPGGGRELLRAMTLFEVAVPQEVVDQLATAAGGTVPPLLALGLVDRFEDLVTPSQPAVALNALVKPRVGRLTASECTDLTRRVLDTLFACWGGAEGDRPATASCELTRLALRIQHAPVLTACAAAALDALDQQFAYRQAAAWAQQIVTLLDTAAVEVPFGLLRRAGEACQQVGEVEPTRVFYDRALAQVRTRQAHGQTLDAFEHSALVLAQARLLAQSGEPDAALLLFEEAQRLALQQGATRNATVVLGDIARLRAQKGDVDEALRLHHERLEVYERLGEVRARAVTLGDIARLRADKGDVDEALRLHHEELEVYERLGEVRARAVTLGDIARLQANKGDVDEALRLHHEQLEVCERLGEVRARAVTLGDIARLQANKGDVDEALRLHHEQLEVYERLGEVRARAVTLGDIARLQANKGDVDEALRLHHEQLEVYERLGEVRARAVTLGDIARLRADKGDVDEALRLHHEQLEVYERLGEVRERAVTLGDIARLQADKGDVDEALRLHHERLEVYERLGEVRARAVTLGDIARLRAQKGDVDEALRLHHEELEVYERLGEVRARAVTLGDIARLQANKGDVDEALRLHHERLTVNRRLGDMDGQAAALWDIAQIELNRGNVEQAAPMVLEAYQIFDRLGRLDGICVIGVTLGQLLIINEMRDEGLAILRRSEQGYRQLQRYRDAEAVAARIAQIEQG